MPEPLVEALANKLGWVMLLGRYVGCDEDALEVELEWVALEALKCEFLK
jgi:hypothetical protein